MNYEITDRRAGDVPKLFASIDLVKNKLGWKPSKSLNEMIKSSWDWERKLNDKSW